MSVGPFYEGDPLQFMDYLKALVVGLSTTTVKTPIGNTTKNQDSSILYTLYLGKCTDEPLLLGGTYQAFEDNYDEFKDGVEVYKARMCALGNRQIEGVNYFKHHVYSPVINSREIHVSLSLAAANDWNIHQSDITQGFTYGSLDEQIFLQPPPGYPCPPGHVLLCQ